MGMKRGYMAPKLNATRIPTESEIAWAAGVYEGEGTCFAKVGKRTQKGRTYKSVTDYLSVTQKDPEILYRMRDLFGGSIYEYQNHMGSVHRWTIHGQRTRNFVQLIYPWLSERRKQQIEAVNAIILANDTEGDLVEALTVGGCENREL
jgi:hypothetical protein